MNILIWIAQIVLALVFVLAGGSKAFSPIGELAMQIPWVSDTPVWVVRLAGYSELVGAVGVVLPSVTRVRPELSWMAAGGLGLVMLMAAGFHLMRGEPQAIVVNVGLLIVSAAVLHGRRKLAPISPR